MEEKGQKGKRKEEGLRWRRRDSVEVEGQREKSWGSEGREEIIIEKINKSMNKEKIEKQI